MFLKNIYIPTVVAMVIVMAEGVVKRDVYKKGAGHYRERYYRE
jgi:hypothetical protein